MTTSSELCEDTETLRPLLIECLSALLTEALEPLKLGEPGFKGCFVTRYKGHMLSMGWRYDLDAQDYWPRKARPLTPVRAITIKVGKEFAGQPVTLFNGTAHPATVNSQGIISFQEEEAVKIFGDTSDLRWS